MAQPPPPGPSTPPQQPPPSTYPPPAQYPGTYPPPSPYYPYPAQPPKSDRTLLIVLVVVIAVIVVIAVVAWIAVSNLFSTPPTGTKPSVTFSSVTLTGNGARFHVTAISHATSPLFLQAKLRVNSDTSTPSNFFIGSATLTIGSDTYTVEWTDGDADGQLSSGDQFLVSRSGGLPTGSAFTFSLLWLDLTTIQTASWTTP